MRMRVNRVVVEVFPFSVFVMSGVPLCVLIAVPRQRLLPSPIMPSSVLTNLSVA